MSPKLLGDTCVRLRDCMVKARVMDEMTHRMVPCLLTSRASSRRERVVEFLFQRKSRKDERGIYAHFALGRATNAIVFVHGFGGRALQTWTRFPDLLQGQPGIADYDLIFYEYDTLGQQLGDMTFALMGFLRGLCTDGSRLRNRALSLAEHRPNGFVYKKLLIVAHSLGAVVIRRALLDADGNKESWVSRSQFILFAPADRGAFSAPLVSEALSGVPFGSLGAAALKQTFPVLVALEPESEDLVTLHDDTVTATADGAAPYLRAQRVLFAEHEEVTKKGKFLVDEWGDAIPGTTHTTVCKPDARDADAVTHVVALL